MRSAPASRCRDASRCTSAPERFSRCAFRSSPRTDARRARSRERAIWSQQIDRVQERAVVAWSRSALPSCAHSKRQRSAGTLEPFEGETDIFIHPGSVFASSTRSITNFHLPESTLLMLVCAFAGTATRTGCVCRSGAPRISILQLRRRHVHHPSSATMRFELDAQRRCRARGTRDDRARFVRTPAFMPVGTYGTVKAMTPVAADRTRRADRARQHVSSAAAARRRNRSRPRRLARLHELARADPDRLRAAFRCGASARCARSARRASTSNRR